MFEFRAGDFVVVACVGDNEDVSYLFDNSVDIWDIFCDRNAFGVFGDEFSNDVVDNGGLPDDLLTSGVEVNVIVDGVTNRVVKGVGTEKGLGTKESMTPAIGPSNPISDSWQVSSSG